MASQESSSHEELPAGWRQETVFDLPGYTLPLDFFPNPDGSDTLPWPNALEKRHYSGYPYDDGDYEAQWQLNRIRLDREVRMMRVMNRITHIPGWETWVFNDDAVAEWLDAIEFVEIVKQNKDDTTQDESANDKMTPHMRKFMVDELQWSAKELQGTGSVTVFDACVKSDTVISTDLREALVIAARSIQEGQAVRGTQDSDSPKVHVVDPFLCPLIYGHSKILPGKHVDLTNCIPLSGTGVTIRLDSDDTQIEQVESIDSRDGVAHGTLWYDDSFQQLPCEVSFSENRCRVISYINNVHPAQHSDLYAVIEEFIEQALPLLSKTVNYHLIPERIPLPEAPDPRALESNFGCYFEKDDGFCRWDQSYGTLLPEPVAFNDWKQVRELDERVSLWTKLRERGLQVIVKVESIELTPDKTKLAAGEWYVEGAPNEHICATAVYCYETTNMTPLRFSFRQRYDVDVMSDSAGVYGLYDWEEYLMDIFPGFEAMDGYGIALQVLGEIALPQGRLLTYPNVFQRQRSELKLIDNSKPGHYKILYLHLVDPNLRIISTANVPPLRSDWVENRAAIIFKLLHSRLPTEVANRVQKELGDETDTPLTMAQAQAYRGGMESSRAQLRKYHNHMFETGTPKRLDSE